MYYDVGMKKTWGVGAVIFAVSFLFYGFITSSGFFPDPDSFYHIRMAMLMRQTPVVHDFPWLTQTVFADGYVDHHWLYHLLLVPFVSLTDPVWGARLFTLLVAAVIPAFFYMLIRSWGSHRLALLSSLILLLSNPFGFRVNLVKAPGVANLFVLALVAMLVRKKYVWITALSVVYVWTYNGWFVFLLVAGAWSMAFCIDAVLTRAWRITSWYRILRQVTAPLVAVGVGSLIGLIVNPYFPKNLSFSWLHIVQIGIIGLKEKIGVGGEWYGSAPLALVAESAFVFGLVIAGWVAMVIVTASTRGRAWRLPEVSSERVRALAITFLAVLFFVLTVRSRRHVEYFIPFAVLAGTSLLLFARHGLPSDEPRRMWDAVRTAPGLLRFPAVIMLTLAVPFLVWRDTRSLKHDFDVGIPPSTYAGAAAWLEQNARSGDIVWHSDWDDFPYFFLHTTRVRYIVGLDPTFMYVHNPDRYWQWVRLTRGEGDFVAHEMRQDFLARFAFVDSQHAALLTRLASDSTAREVYRDREGVLFDLVQTPVVP